MSPGESAHERARIVVVGAGAAGLWAAARAAELGGDVLLLEKTPRLGTKVLASGGTRCNLTTTLDADAAARLFGRSGERFLRRALRALPPLELRRRFHELGVETVEAPLEKVFPRSGRARDVRDALARWAREAGARIRTRASVAGLEAVASPSASEAGPSPWASRWRVRLEDGAAVECESLLLCPGGKSYPRTGTTGDGYRWLADLGLELVEPAPALVPLVSRATWVRELAGIDLQNAVVRLVDGAGRELGRRERPIVFTHRGVSGPGAMDLSEHVARGSDLDRMALVVDCLPGVEREQLRHALIEAASRAGAPRLLSTLASLGDAPPPRRLVAAVARQAGLDEPNPPASTLSKAARHELIESLKGLRVPIDGTLGFDAAEVTAGGLALAQVDPGSMRVRGVPGLFVFGEVLDVQGPIGGLNFQAAFATADRAAVAATSA